MGQPQVGVHQLQRDPVVLQLRAGGAGPRQHEPRGGGLLLPEVQVRVPDQEPLRHQGGGHPRHLGHQHPRRLHGLPLLPGARAEPARRGRRRRGGGGGRDLLRLLPGLRGAARRRRRGEADAVVAEQLHPDEHLPGLLRRQQGGHAAEQVEAAGAGAEEEHLRQAFHAQLTGERGRGVARGGRGNPDLFFFTIM